MLCESKATLPMIYGLGKIHKWKYFGCCNTFFKKLDGRSLYVRTFVYMRISRKKCNYLVVIYRVSCDVCATTTYYCCCLLNRKRPVIKTATFVPNLQNESMDRKVWIPFYGLLSIEKWSHIGTLIRHRKRGRKQQQPSQLVKHIYHIQMMYYMVQVLHTHLHITLIF